MIVWTFEISGGGSTVAAARSASSTTIYIMAKHVAIPPISRDDCSLRLTSEKVKRELDEREGGVNRSKACPGIIGGPFLCLCVDDVGGGGGGRVEVRGSAFLPPISLSFPSCLLFSVIELYVFTYGRFSSQLSLGFTRFLFAVA